MHKICRGCFGNPKVFQHREKCITCKKSRAEYIKLKLENECNEMLYLRQTWLKVRNFRQASTGIGRLDDVIIMLFGIPYPDFFDRKKQCRDIAAYKLTNAHLIKMLTIEADDNDNRRFAKYDLQPPVQVMGASPSAGRLRLSSV